jgi:hypothetical protein
MNLATYAEKQAESRGAQTLAVVDAPGVWDREAAGYVVAR